MQNLPDWVQAGRRPAVLTMVRPGSPCLTMVRSAGLVGASRLVCQWGPGRPYASICGDVRCSHLLCTLDISLLVSFTSLNVLQAETSVPIGSLAMIKHFLNDF